MKNKIIKGSIIRMKMASVKDKKLKDVSSCPVCNKPFAKTGSYLYRVMCGHLSKNILISVG